MPVNDTQQRRLYILTGWRTMIHVVEVYNTIETKLENQPEYGIRMEHFIASDLATMYAANELKIIFWLHTIKI